MRQQGQTRGVPLPQNAERNRPLGSGAGEERRAPRALGQALGQDGHNCVGNYGKAPQGASYWGPEQVAQLLPDQRADVNAQSEYYGNALQMASFGGHEQVAQLLLDKGADINAQGGEYGNALLAASIEG